MKNIPCTFESLNARFGCNTLVSQLYFDRFEVVELHYSVSTRPFWRIFGYAPNDAYYIDCAWLDLPSDYEGLAPGIYHRPQLEMTDCAVCHSAPFYTFMFPTTGNSNAQIPMCHDCAWKAFEAGTHESDLNQ